MRTQDVGRAILYIPTALFTGLLALQTALAIVHFAGKDGSGDTPSNVPQNRGGESIVAKLPAVAVAPKREPVKIAELESAPVAHAEPRLEGLLDIPRDSLDRLKPKAAQAKAFAADPPDRQDVLPWDAVEPVIFHPGETPAPKTGVRASVQSAMAPPAPAQQVRLPAYSVESWVRAKTIEIKGENRGRPLYHLEIWLDAPEDVKRNLAAVAYDFNTPAIMPQSLVSNERKTGFRVAAGGRTCADKITITLKFNDGESQQVEVDGCHLSG